MKKIKIIGHRGYLSKAPENTLASFELAVKLGVDAIEFDLHQTSDKKLIIHHDYTLGRTDNGSGNIFQKSFKEISKIDAGSWFDKKFSNEKIPTPEEVFERFKDTIEYEIELKESTIEFLDKLIETVKKYNLLDKVEFTSPHVFLLAKLKQKYPQVKTGVFFKIHPDWMTQEQGERIILNTLLLLPADVAHLPVSIINKNFIKTLKKHGKLVHAADCNDKISIQKINKLNCDQFSTNEVELAQTTLK